MKIGLINNLYKPYQKGGAERIVEILEKQLQDLGHSVFIISTKSSLKKDGERENVYYLKSAYSDLIKWPYFRRLIWQIQNLINIKKYFEITKILKIEKPDLIISHNLMGLGLLTPLAIKKSGIRQIHILHDIQLLHPSGLIYYGQEDIINSYFAKIYQSLVNLLFKLGGPRIIIVSPSTWLLNLHLSHGLFKKNTSRAISNPFPGIDKNIKEKTDNNFIFIGQLEYHKGLDLFIAAAARFTDYNFLVIGDGPLKDQIKETANVKILGRKNSEEITALLKKSLAIIIPSRCHENSPTVIYEAAAVNTPAIAANLGGIPELINRFGGLLFEPDNLDSLTMAITEFLKTKPEVKTQEIKENYAQEILKLL